MKVKTLLTALTFFSLFEFVVVLPLMSQLLLAESSAVKGIKLPVAAEGLSVSLWAADEMLSNPTGMAIDSRGRIWVAEGVNYRLWSKQNKQFKRVPHADRIKILEDTNHDGKADKVTIFAEDIFPIPQGLALQEIWKDGQYIGMKVYTGSGSDLFVIEDSNGDDKADKRSVLLSGFRGLDSDHGLHGMAMGPDGKLYFTVGDGRYGIDREARAKGYTFDVTDKSGRRLQNDKNGTTLRVNRDGTQFEIICTGQRNNYETCLNSFGHVFTSDNDDDGNRGCRMIWAMDGGHYGYKHPESNHHWAEEIPGNIPKLAGTGNGAPCGILVYEGSLFPQKYHGSVIQIDAGTHQVNHHPLQRHGAAWRSDYQVLLKGNDEKFRPVDAAVAPDGSLYVCDWYDSGVGGHRFTDQKSGRIFRVFPSGSKQAFPMARFNTVEQSINALQSCNLTTSVAARDVLIQKGVTAREAVIKLFVDGKPHERARALYLLADLSDGKQSDVVAALKDASPEIRELAIRILAKDVSRNGVMQSAKSKGTANKQHSRPPATSFLDVLLPMANDQDAGVRRELLLAFRSVDDHRAKAAINKMATSAMGNDRYYLEAIKLAMQDWNSEMMKKFFDELGRFTLQKNIPIIPTSAQISLPPYVPVSTNESFRKIGDSLPAHQTGELQQVQTVIALSWILEREEAIPLLKKILGRYSHPEIIRGIDLSLERISSPQAATVFIDQFNQVKNIQRRRAILLLIGQHLGNKWKSVRDSKQTIRLLQESLDDHELRTAAIKTIAKCQSRQFGENLLAFATDEKQEMSIRVAAMEAMGHLKYQPAQKIAAKIVQQTKGKQHAGSFAQSALLVMLNLGGNNAANDVRGIIRNKQFPFDFRKRALQVTVMKLEGAKRVMALVQTKKLSTELTTEAQFLLHNHPDRTIRRLAIRQIPRPRSSKGKQLPDIDNILTLTGDVKSGSQIFHTASKDKATKRLACASCHRVQGRGQWVGPDLSSVGTKYGKRELLFHIFNPSSTINYNYVTYTIATEDGLVRNGLIADENSDRIVLKTALGERIDIAKSDIDSKKTEHISIMPNNLTEAMTEKNIADLVAYLATLRKPVSAAGEFSILGPVANTNLKLPTKVDLKQPVTTKSGEQFRWQPMRAGRDSYLDLSSMLGSNKGRLLNCLLVASVEKQQSAKLVVVSPNNITGLTINGKEITTKDISTTRKHLTTSTYPVNLPSGSNQIIIQLSSGVVDSGLMVTLISEGNETIRFQPIQ